MKKSDHLYLKRFAALVCACVSVAISVFAGDDKAAPINDLPQNVHAMFEKHCFECHDGDTKKGGLDLSTLKPDFANAETFARWVKVHDRIESGEMPPKKKPRPESTEVSLATSWLSPALIKAERARLDEESRTGVRRMTRSEYENTIRDLFDLSGIALQNALPADGSAHGFDKNSDALDISHVNMAKYLETGSNAECGDRHSTRSAGDAEISHLAGSARLLDCHERRRGDAEGQSS